MQVFELALCQVHRPVSEPLLELRAPLVRHLLQVAEPAPRLVQLTLLLELRGQLVLLDRTPLCYLLVAGLLSRAEKIFRSRIIIPTGPNPGGISKSLGCGLPPKYGI